MVLLARDIMDPHVRTVDPGAKASDVARDLVESHKGYAVLVDSKGAIAGIVTEWDFLAKVLATGADPRSTPVAAIASPVVHSCTPETPAEDAVARMAKEGIRRLVVRTDQRVVGIITSRNVLAMFRQYVDKLSAEIAAYHTNPSPMG